jgi:hypothetical protein
MRCHEINELLSAYFDGMLDPPDRTKVDRHLNGCPACRAELEDLSLVVGLVSALPLVEPPVEFRPGLRLKLENLKPPGSAPGVIKKLVAGRWSTMVALAASFLLVFGIAGAWPQLASRFDTGKQETAMQSQLTGHAPGDDGSVAFDKSDGGGRTGTEKTLSTTNAAPEKSTEPDQGVKMAAKLPAPDNSGARKAQNTETTIVPPRATELGAGDVTGRGAIPGGHLMMKASAEAPSQRTFVDVKSADIGAAMRHISEVARMHGGSVLVPQESGGREMTVTIPGSQFDKVMAEIGTTGTVTRIDPYGADRVDGSTAARDQKMGITSAPTVNEVYGKGEGDLGATVFQTTGAGSGEQLMGKAVKDEKAAQTEMSSIVIRFE